MCSRCQTVKGPEGFVKGHPHHYICLNCDGAKAKLWSAKNRAKHTISRVKGRGVTKLSVDELSALVDRQDGQCAICGQRNADGRALYIDHSHITGSVRALLCHRCNIGIGMFRDDPALLVKATQYLLSFSELAKIS